MPNHVTNKLIIHSKQIAPVVDFIKSENSQFDFNTLLPMPKCLDIEESTLKDMAFIYALTDGYVKDFSPQWRHRQYFGSALNPFGCWGEELEKSKDYFERIKNDADKLKEFKDLSSVVLDNYNKYGCSSWAQWCPKNWGTKWNAYDISIKENYIQFDTAWASPLPVINLLIGKFNLSCTFKAYDEGGHFWFIKEYENGVLVKNQDSLDEHKNTLALELKGRNLEEYEGEE